MRTVTLHGKKGIGRVAIVDDEDYDLVCAHNWRVQETVRPDGSITGPYAFTRVRRGGRQVTIAMHQLITGYPMTDHIDHNGLNNQRYNLRPATTRQNSMNMRSFRNSSSRYKGVTWHRKNKKWQASIHTGGKTRYLGCFSVEEDAARAYNAVAVETFGSYACLNEVAQ